jgi:hypothetical protein
MFFHKTLNFIIIIYDSVRKLSLTPRKLERTNYRKMVCPFSLPDSFFCSILVPYCIGNKIYQTFPDLFLSILVFKKINVILQLLEWNILKV